MSGLEKAQITNTVTGARVPVLFNPEEYTVSKEVTYAQANVPGLSAPILQFVHGGMSTLELELFLDTFEEHLEGGRVVHAAGTDVRTLVAKVTDLMAIDASTHAPPVALFTWGSLAFSCVLARATQRYVMFLPDGTPVRARLHVTFNEFRNADLEAKEIKRETADYTKLHVVAEGDTLSSIAAGAYDDPTQWRPIAMANDIDDPRLLAVGGQLVVPRLPFLDPTSGEPVR